MKKVSEIWEELTLSKTDQTGLITRRLPTWVIPDIFAAVSVPDGLRCLAVSVSDDVNSEFESDLRDLTLEVNLNGPNKGKQFIVLKLINRQFEDIFAVLCDDLVSQVAEIRDDKELVSELFGRLNLWAMLFEKASSDGLSQEAQRGLYGELYLLRRMLSYGCDPAKSISSWLGPARMVRDFQHGDFAIEVKTTHGNNHQRLKINGERQLDPSNLKGLFLFHLSLETLQGSQESLNEVVDSLLSLVSHSIAANFRSKLYQYGYFDHHRHLYDGVGYKIRSATFYEVKGTFPRIDENELRPGVGDVKYSIIVTQCVDFMLPENDVLEQMNIR